MQSTQRKTTGSAFLTQQVATMHQKDAARFLDDFWFERKHPFLREWDTWQQVVSKYYESRTTSLLDILFNVRSPSLFDQLECNDDDGRTVIYGSYGSHEWPKISGSKEFKTYLQQKLEEKHGAHGFFSGFCCIDEKEFRDSLILYDEDAFNNVEYKRVFPYEGCEQQRAHLLKVYLSLIVAMSQKAPKYKKKYYRSLARVLLSLPVKNLKQFDMDIILNPEETGFIKYRRNLLKRVYATAYFDTYNQKDLEQIAFKFEEWKHLKNPTQQSGTSQSVSATMFEELVNFARDVPVVEQGLLPKDFTVIHDFVSESPAYEKFSQAVAATQEKFFSAMKDTLTSTAKEIACLFLVTATIGLLGYSALKFGQHLILKTLNLLYKVACGKIGDNDLSIKQQNGGISIPLIPAMILNNVIQPPAAMLGNIWSNSNTDKIMRRIGYLGDPKIAKGVDRISDWVKKAINETVKWFKETWLGISSEEDIESTCCPVVKWQEDCDEFFKLYFEGKMVWNDITWSVIMNLYARGLSLTRQKCFIEFKNDIWRVVSKLGNILEKFNAKGRVGTSIRNPPVTIYMCGGTGVGKSSITYPIAAEILKGIFQREKCPVDLIKYWKHLIYMRSSEQEYWDGYQNQLVTVFDDFSQMVDSQGNPNIELFEIIRAANSFPYPLHMASIEEKATTTFNSKIILVSSNLEQPKTTSLNFPTALYRRFDISVQVTRKPGAVVEKGKFNPNIYQFQLYDMATGELGDFVSYKDIIYKAVTEYFNRKGFVDSMDEYITEKLSEPDSVPSNPFEDLPDNPVQQGFGTAAGNTIHGIKMCVKNTINSVQEGLLDFKSAMNGDIHHRYMTEARIAVESMRFKMLRACEMWKAFQEENPYIIKAMKFVGILALIAGVLKLYSSFTSSSPKKEKFMSPEQFVSGTKEESFITEKVFPNHKFGPYVAEHVTHVYPQYRDAWKAAGSPSSYYVQGNNVVPESYSPVASKSVKVEGYNSPQVKPVKAEGLVNYVCQHQIRDQIMLKDPFRYYQITQYNEKCGECKEQPREQGVKDINAAEMLMKIVRSNLYKIYNLDSHEHIGHAMFLRGKIVMCPRHYLAAFKRIQGVGGSNRVYFRNVFLNRAFEVDVNEIISKAQFLESPSEHDTPVMSRDIMAFPVVTATYHGDIAPFFADRENLSFVKNTDIVLPVLLNNNISKSERSIVALRFASGRSQLSVKEITKIENDEGVAVRMMRNLWEYSMDTQPAECGAPLIARNVNIAPGKIIGMHVAGIEGSGLGYSTPVYRQDINKILGMFSDYDTVEFRIKSKLKEYPKEQCQVPEEAEFIRLGSIDKPVAQPVKSKILPSPLYGEIRKPKTKPCALRPTVVEGKEFDPRKYRLGRLGNIPQFIRQLEIDHAEKALVDEISDQIKDINFGPNIKAVYTFDETVKGIDGEEYINSIKRNTSPGYPFVHMPGFQSRKQIFGDGEEVCTSSPACQVIRRQVEKIIEDIKSNVVTEHIFMDTLKDERKPLHKAHKTRLFSAGPLDYLIACKMYFNGIVAVLQKARNFSHVSVGTNPHSQDWTNIARSLLSKSKYIIAGDFEGFDASQVVQLLQASGRVLIELSKRFCGTTDEEAKIMWCLLISLFNSVHVTGTEIYMWTHSLPSGHYLTAIINSIFVLLCFCIVWQKAFENPTYVMARKFFKKCGIVAYGDDHLVSVPQEYLDKFNQQSLISLFSSIGLGYTMEDKDAKAEAPARQITEVSYLKRRFQFNKDRQFWLGPITLDTILETPMWVHKCPDPTSQTKEELDGSLRELSIHEPEAWNTWSQVLILAGKRIGHYTDYVHQDETRSEVLD